MRFTMYSVAALADKEKIMKKIGYLLITIGFLGGSLVAVLNTTEMQWNLFAIAFIVGVAGVVIVRTGHKQSSQHERKLASNMQSIETSLKRIVDNMTTLNTQKESIDTYDVRHRIDELFGQDLTEFVQARESIEGVYGLQAYADVMSYFASGERYLNRVWSASADGYIDEVNEYIEKAQVQFRDALEKVNKLKMGAALNG